MHLLEANSDSSFSLTSFRESVPAYAILSHTWDADDHEVTFQDVMGHTKNGMRNYRKLQFCAEQAKNHGLRYFWVDSCCIDRSNSTELQEAINSMFRWYQKSAKCFVYLSDVLMSRQSPSSEKSQWELAFRQSRWFTRGWTLQELLAPQSVEFYCRDGNRLGDKASLEQQIHEITGIAIRALRGDALSGFSDDERKAWAANRETTIEEDQVYCLFGIYGVFMPLIYGEGKEHALHRLQVELDQRSAGDKQANWTHAECMKSLYTSEYTRFKDRNPDRDEGTCQWFLKHPHFQEWQDNSASCLLWVSADPGCGKSVLARSLIDREMKPTASRVTCYFFFKDDSEQQKSTTAALCALLHQLFLYKKTLIKYAIQDCVDKDDKLPQSFDRLWSVLLKATSDREAGEVVCILDAIDECPQSGRYQIIEALNALYKKAASEQKIPQLKFLVTSRPYFDIERRFKALVQDIPTVHLDGVLEHKTISSEINAVIHGSVLRLGRELNLNGSETSMLESELLGRENRTYLWLKLILEILRAEIRITKQRLKQVVGDLPTTVDHAYEEILSKVPDKKRAQKLLRIIVSASIPLTLEQLNEAVTIEDHHKCYSDLDLEDATRFAPSVRNACGLFISIVDQKVYLIHQTAKEFLVGNSKLLDHQWKHSLDPPGSDLLMARICVKFLQFPDLDSSCLRIAKHRELTNYADFYWLEHFRRVQNIAAEELLQSVLEFCDPWTSQFQDWFRIFWESMPRYGVMPSFTCNLMVQSYFGLETLVKRLLIMGKLNVNSKDDAGRTSLSWAAGNGHEAVVYQLIKTRKAKVNLKDERGRTPLSWAAEEGHEAVVRLLLDIGRFKQLLVTGKVGVDLEDKNGRTPLALAAINGHEGVVKLLLATGKVEPNVEDRFRYTPLALAASIGHEGVVKLLLATGKVELNVRDQFVNTPLSSAAYHGHEDIVKLLLATGKVEVNTKDLCGQTPLIIAASGGHEAIVKLLLATGKVEVNAKDMWGRTPLAHTAQYGHEAIVKLLLATGEVEVNVKDQDGQTPLSRAARGGHEAILKLLLATGKVEVDIQDQDGRTPIDWAAENGHDTVIKLLTVRDRSGSTISNLLP